MTRHQDHLNRVTINHGRISVSDARNFAESWQQAWNDHDLDAVLSHFAPDVTFTSPVAAQLLPDSDGTLTGLDALRAYWAVGLERIPELHFDVIDVYVGISTIVINYRNHTGGLVNEVLTINCQGLVIAGAGTYLVADAAGVSGATDASQ